MAKELQKRCRETEFRSDWARVFTGRFSSLGYCVRRIASIIALLSALPLVAGFAAALVEEEEKSSTDLVRMGDEAFATGRYSAAMGFYRSALKRDESNFTARLKLVELLSRLAGREAEAKKEMEIALGIKSLSPAEIGRMAEICRANGFPEEARSAYDRLLKENPDDLAALGKLIEVLLSQRDFKGARTKIEAYRYDSASTVEGLEMLAAKCSGRSQYKLAEVAYEDILKRDERNLQALLGSGECLARSWRFPEAIERVSRAVELHPEKTEPQIALGEILLRTGDYDSAEAEFARALRIGPRSEKAVEGLVAVYFSTGRYSEAKKMLSEALEAQPNSPVLLVAMGRILNYLGEYESARRHFERALAVRRGYPGAILGLGLSYRNTGKLDLAKEQFLRLYDFWDVHLDELDSVHPRDMVQVAVACALTDNPQDAIDVLEQLLKRDATNAEALLWEARLFAERHQPKDAIRELKKLLRVNPNHPEANAELASIYLESTQYDLAAESCQRALRTNPNFVRALEILCSFQILDFDYREAENTAKKALAINPRSLSSLSALASCYWQMGNEGAYEAVRRKVFDINPLYGEFYLTVARACEGKRRNQEAIELLKQAVRLKPDYAPAYTRIGILLMREGEEEEAETYLKKSYRLDSYNPMTANFIKLLQQMKENFQTTRTEHFLIKWDREKGAVLGHFLPEYVEKVYAEVCEEFGYEPRNPTLLEIFDSHDQFSARIAGLPFIATVGASLGKVIAADSPKKASFDWKDVLRHEFVHVVNLQQSKMQIPFWFTEGLATYHEESPHPVEWDAITAGMLYMSEIIPLNDLNSYFTRPKTLMHKQAAYAESNLICRYLYEKHGLKVIRKMIEMYGDNSSTEEVIQQCLSMSQSEFEREIGDYIFAEAREKRVPPLFLIGGGELIAEGLEAKPEDSLLRVARARWLFVEARAPRILNEAKLDEAAQILAKLIEENPEARIAYTTLAEIHLARGRYDEAKDAALKAIAVDENDFAAHRCLGLVHQKTGKMKEVIAELEKAVELYPRATDVWVTLTLLYKKEKDETGRIRSLEGLVCAYRKDMRKSKQLATVYLSNKKYDEAIRALERALRYNLYDGEIYSLMVRAFEGKGDERSAKKYAEIGAEAAYISAKSLMPFQKKKVVELLNLALELNPKHEKGRSLLNRIGGGNSTGTSPIPPGAME